MTTQSTRALVIVASEFNDTELFGALRVLKREGVPWTIASRNIRISGEDSREYFSANVTLDDLDLEQLLLDYDLLFIIGGETNDVLWMWTSSQIEQIVREMYAADKVVAATCRAAPCIRYVARGKRVTGFPIVEVLEYLRASGGIITGKSLECDERVVTAEAPALTEYWAQAAVNTSRGIAPPELSETAWQHLKHWKLFRTYISTDNDSSSSPEERPASKDSQEGKKSGKETNPDTNRRSGPLAR